MKEVLVRTIGILFVAIIISMPVQPCVRIFGRTIQNLIQDSETIVVAKAVEYEKHDPPSDLLMGPGKSTIRFEIEETLKGKLRTNPLVLVGTLTETDDFNDHPVPYEFVRPHGRHGSCWAYHYKKGALFLLFLKTEKGVPTPYWEPMAPANEQLQSKNDPWVFWVKGYLAGLEGQKGKGRARS